MTDASRIVQPGEEGYEDGFDICPEPTCPLYGKAVMADHRHLKEVAGLDREHREREKLRLRRPR